MKLLIDILILLRYSKTFHQHPAKRKPHPLHGIRKNPGATKLSAESIRIIQQNRRPSNTKRYDNYIGKWKVFCWERDIDPISKSLDQSIEFLIKVFESGVGYSSVDTARSAHLLSLWTMGYPLENNPLFSLL